MNRLLNFVFLIPLGIVLVALAVANRASVPFTIDPFDPGSPGLTVEWPLFVYLFAALVLGLLVGAFATWLGQRRYRKLARERGHEVDRLRAETPGRRHHTPALPGPQG